jgi:WhiB family redox-sensing transcriptional regulator
MAETQMPDVVSAQAKSRDWFRLGVCRQSDLGPDAWFPASRNPADSQEARQACRTCPVRKRCLSEALRMPDAKGIWGGTDELDRRRLQMAGD